MGITNQLSELFKKAMEDPPPDPFIAAFWHIVVHFNGNRTGAMGIADVALAHGPSNYQEAMMAVVLGFSDCPEFDEEVDGEDQ